jgi:hypothetical protein
MCPLKTKLRHLPPSIFPKSFNSKENHKGVFAWLHPLAYGVGRSLLLVWRMPTRSRCVHPLLLLSSPIRSVQTSTLPNQTNHRSPLVPDPPRFPCSSFALKSKFSQVLSMRNFVGQQHPLQQLHLHPPPPPHPLSFRQTSFVVSPSLEQGQKLPAKKSGSREQIDSPVSSSASHVENPNIVLHSHVL